MPSLTTEFSLFPGTILVKYRKYVNAEAAKNMATNTTKRLVKQYTPKADEE